MNFRQVHLDFHTSGAIDGVGAKFNKEQFQNALKVGHVNSITLFAKCHHGYAYFNSTANVRHPGMPKDFELLREQIKAAHEIGVKAPIYISVGIDEKLARLHPEWLIRDRNEKTTWAESFDVPGYHIYCLNNAYVDEVVAQTKEVCNTFKDLGIDGLFFDIVGVRHCYCQKCCLDMLKEGKNPYNEKDNIEFAEKVYANYTRKIREAVDEIDPSIHVFHNGGHIRRGKRDIAFMNSHLELESLPTGGWGYDHFPLSARYVQQLGMDYLGMTGKFHGAWGEFGGFKHPNALRYECALSVANGAKCSVGDQCNPSGKMDMVTYKTIGEAYSEIEKIEPWLDNVSSVADVGVLSLEATNEFVGIKATEDTYNSSDAGVVRIMLEGKYLFDVLDMESDFSKYKVIVLPDEVKCNEEMVKRLKTFVKNGGKILASGKSGLKYDKNEFAFDFGVKYEGESEHDPSYLRPLFEYETAGDTAYLTYAKSEKVSLNGGKALAYLEKPYFNRTLEHFCSHKNTPNCEEYDGIAICQGKDGIYFSHSIFTAYAESGILICKQAVKYALDILLENNKTVVTDLPQQGVTTLMEQKCENRFVSHILYATPVKRGGKMIMAPEIIEDIIPLYNVKMEYKLDKKVKKVYLAPQNEELKFEEKDGIVYVVVPKLDCHQVIVLDY